FDSTSHGGTERRRGLMWEADAGHTFRLPPLRRRLGFAPPWAGYQLAAPAGVFPVFDNSGSLLNADYQFGASLEIQWNGPPVDQAAALPPFSRPMITSRMTVLHRSSHLGDEYLTESRFGRNQEGNDRAGTLFDHPPVKRVDLTYEELALALSAEWSPRGVEGGSVARVYTGVELKPAFPPRWGIGALRPHNFDSPAWRIGGEWRSAGNAPAGREALIARLVNQVMRRTLVHSGWI